MLNLLSFRQYSVYSKHLKCYHVHNVKVGMDYNYIPHLQHITLLCRGTPKTENSQAR